MALIVAVKKGDVSSWRGTAELIDDIRQTIAERTASLVDGESVELLSAIRDEIAVEIIFDESLAARLGELFRDVDAADSVQRLKIMPGRCVQLVSEYFERRGSVVAVHEVCTRFFGRIFLKLAALTASAPELEMLWQEELPWCWLAAEEAGREEMTTMNGHRLFLVYDDSLSHAADRFRELSRRVGQALGELGITTETASGSPADLVWCGSSKEWQVWLQIVLTPPEQHAVLPALPALAAPFRLAGQGEAGFLDPFATVADLRLLAGNGETGRSLLLQAHGALGRLPVSIAFAQAARQVAAMPVALNLFGRFKVERSGKHRGEFDIEAHALSPLVTNVRLLAITHGIMATGTIERVRALLAGGHLNVDAAEKVVRAYHEITRQKLRMEIRGQRGDGLFLNPEDLNDAEGQKFKVALEAVVALERLVHAQFMEKM